MKKKNYISPAMAHHPLCQPLMVKTGSHTEDIEKGQEEEGEDPNGTRLYRWRNFDEEEEENEW